MIASVGRTRILYHKVWSTVFNRNKKVFTLLSNCLQREYCNKMNLNEVCVNLNKIAPTQLAAKWDNVGLLVEPTAPHTVETILLTNDLTENVLDEAISISADLIVSYHPPIFQAMKKLTGKSWKERIVVKAIENRIAIYSPHTASDAVENGANEWLSRSIGELESCVPISISQELPANCKLVSFVLNSSAEYNTDDVLDHFKRKFNNADVSESENSKTYHITLQCNTSTLQQVVEFCEATFPNNCNDVKVQNLSEKPILCNGVGRLCTLRYPCSLISLVERVKEFINLPHIRLAVGRNVEMNVHQCKTVALCPGSGTSVVKGVKADVYLTGEMSHHDILDATSNGTSVILCEHSNSERGYLYVMKSMLEDLNDKNLNIIVSDQDRDPIEIV